MCSQYATADWTRLTQPVVDYFALGDYANFQGEDVPDPYFFNGFEGFEKVYQMISLCVEDFLAKVENGSL